MVFGGVSDLVQGIYGLMTIPQHGSAVYGPSQVYGASAASGPGVQLGQLAPSADHVLNVY